MSDNFPCIVVGCFKFAAPYNSRCEEHILPPFFGNNRAARLPSDWNFRRSFVLKRDEGICYMCGNPGADGVDHLVNDDDNSFDNLKAVHHNVEPFCHSYKTAEEGVVARDNNRPSLDKTYWLKEYERRYGKENRETET